MFISNVKSVVIWVLMRIKISMIILDEFVDFIKVIRIKMFAFYAEMSLNRFGKGYNSNFQKSGGGGGHMPPQPPGSYGTALD